MRIVVANKKEQKLLTMLLDYLGKRNIEFFLDFEEPLSFQLEDLFAELIDCDIEPNKEEDPLGII